MNCTYCGKLLPNDSEFCAYCGKPVEKDLTPKCGSCGKQVTEDSLFCPYCGTPIGPFNNTKQTPAKSALPKKEEKKRSKKAIIYVVIAVVVVVLAAVFLCQPIDPQSTLPPVREPTSGTLLECNTSAMRYSKLTVHADKNSACVVKVNTVTGYTILSFYVRAGESITVDVPSALLQVSFASGQTWYGENHLFGNKTKYSMNDELLDFSEYPYEYTLYPGASGKFNQTPIDANKF